MQFNDFVSGAYYSDCKVTKPKDYANDMNKIMESLKLIIEEIKKRFPDTKAFDIVNNMFKN